VNVGDLLGASGNSGNSTGPHLSYDVSDASGTYVDPTSFVSGGGSGSQTPAYTGEHADFYSTFGPAAQQFAQQYGVDPSFLLGMAASETNWGAASGYNVGGMMGSGTAGSKQFTSQGSDAPGSTGTFAQYNSPDEGYQAFFNLITDPNGRYAGAWANFQKSGDSAQLFRDLQQSGYTRATDWPDLVSNLAGQTSAALQQGAGASTTTQTQNGLVPANGATPVQQTRLDQNQADFDAGRIDEATYYARKDAIQAEIDAAKKARDTARAAAQYDAEQAQQKAALEAYAANLTAQGFHVFHNPDGTPSFYYDAQNRPVPINYVPERGRVEAGTPGDVDENEVLRALNEGATFVNPNGTSAAMQAYNERVQAINGPSPTPVARVTSLGTLSPEAAAAYLLSGTEGRGLAGVSGSVMKGLDLNSPPTFQELLGYIGTSLPGTGSSLQDNAGMPNDIQQEYARRYRQAIDQGTSPEEANYIAQVATDVTKGATSILQGRATELADTLNARGFDPSGSGGFQTGEQPGVVLNKFGQPVDEQGYAEGADLTADAASLGYSVQQGEDGLFYVIDKYGNRASPGYSTAALAQQNIGIDAYQFRNKYPNARIEPPGRISDVLRDTISATRTLTPSSAVLSQPRPAGNGVHVEPPMRPPVAPPPTLPPPAVEPPNYGGGPVIYQPAASSVQAPQQPLSAIVSNFAGNASVLNSVNALPQTVNAPNVPQIISEQERRRKRNPFVVAAAPNPFARVA
jgi:hypothetical protein